MKKAQDEIYRMLAEGQTLPFLVRRCKLLTVWTDMNGVTPTEATIQTEVANQPIYTAGDGVGPINALDIALKKAVDAFFPEIEEIVLVSFKIEAENTGSDATVQCTARFRSGKSIWISSAEHANQDYAAWKAVLDGYLYGIMSTKEANKE